MLQISLFKSRVRLRTYKYIREKRDYGDLQDFHLLYLYACFVTSINPKARMMVDSRDQSAKLHPLFLQSFPPCCTHCVMVTGRQGFACCEAVALF
jgi:hypothetical protein